VVAGMVAMRLPVVEGASGGAGGAAGGGRPWWTLAMGGRGVLSASSDGGCFTMELPLPFPFRHGWRSYVVFVGFVFGLMFLFHVVS
jgi:hypothetical protein